MTPPSVDRRRNPLDHRPREFRLAVVVWFLVAVIVTPFIAIGGIMFSRFVAAEHERSVGAVSTRVDLLAKTIDRRLRDAEEAAGALAVSPDLIARDFTRFGTTAAAFLGEGSGRILVFDPDGAVVFASSGGPPGGMGAEPDAIAAVIDDGGAVVGRLSDHPGGKAAEAYVYVPVRSGGHTTAVLGLSLPLDEILAIVKDSLTDAGWFASVSDGKRRIIARSFRNDEFFGQYATAGFFDQLGDEQGILNSVDLEGREVLTGFAHSQASDWVVFTWVPQAILSAPARRAIWLLLLVPGVTILCSFIVAAGASRMVLRPLRRLHRMAAEIGQGRAVRFDPTMLYEANVVGGALAEASSRLSQTVSELKSRSREIEGVNSRLNLALESARASAWDLDLGVRRSGRASGGDEAGEPILIDDFLAAQVHPDDRERVSQSIRGKLAAGDREIVEDYRVILPDHGIRWVSARGTVERDDAGTPVRVTGLSQDITERKETEEHIQLLLREVNHRSKNMLAVVQAIARATAASDSREFLARFTDRVQALSASQDLLVQSNWRGADMGDLARAQLAHFADLIGGRIRLEGDTVLLRPVASQAIGMALHELATNAGKYGALSNEEGRIVIAWRADRVPEGRFRISWTESGGPEAGPPDGKGFGTTVIEVMSRRSLNADVEYEIGPGGVSWILDCSVQAAVEGSALTE